MAQLVGWRSKLAGSQAYWVLFGFIIAVFALGGGSRGDIASLMVLRPLSMAVVGLGLASLGKEHVTRHRWLFGLAAISILLTGLQLVPLPPSLVHALPGHQVLNDIDAVAGLGSVWRPASLAPTQTWNALWSLSTPVAVLILAAQLEKAELEQLGGLLLAVGLTSIVLALLQMIGDPGGAAYLYADTNNGSPVGLFANRNHQAVFIASLLPLAAAWAMPNRMPARKGSQAEAGWRVLAALGLTFTVIPLVLITGSRAGLAAAIVAVIATPMVVGPATLARRLRELGAGKHGAKLGFTLVAAMIAITGATIWIGRAEAVRRLIGGGEVADLRVETLPALVRMAVDYLPWGAGFGAFKPAYRIHETDSVLAPEMMNHAHNDWLETVQLGGIGGAILLAAMLFYVVSAAQRIWVSRGAGTNDRLARCGLTIMAIFALASLSDYPLRAPSLCCYFVLAAVWAGGLGGGSGGRSATGATPQSNPVNS